ncbi:TDT family transporter [Aureimonas sp. N4]|uniref:TDT family transporter n=1 Tax=Aureimonas sp. N4 TaxID=1638165 RepID=UPI000783FF0F|nr:TDT family transporter [Aureimonas sp. N4]
MTFEQMRAVSLGLHPLSRLDSPREVVRQFTPNWFAATMGTGILAIALAQFGTAVPVLHAIGEGLWMLNIGLFALFTALYAARWIFFFDGAKRIFGHSVVSMFFGCIPMGLATIINGFLVFGLPRFGSAAVGIAETLWWIDVAMAAACGVAIPYMMFTRQSHSIDQMTAVWLLPMVAAEVAAVSGGLLAPHLADPQSQLLVLTLSYALWALSVPIAMSVLVVLVLRLAVHKLPHASMASSSWLALGPIGTGALGLMTLGGAAPAILAANGLERFGATMEGVGLVGGLLLWGYGLWWLAIATLVTVRYVREGLPFNLGWWGYTFPIGVYAVTTLKLGTILPIPAIHGFGVALVVLLAVVWSIVAVRTVRGAWRGDLFVAPCLKAN